MKQYSIKYNLYKIFFGTAFTFSLLVPQDSFSMYGGADAEWKWEGEDASAKAKANIRVHPRETDSSHPIISEERRERKIKDANKRLKDQKGSVKRRKVTTEKAEKKWSTLAEELAPKFSMNKDDLYTLIRDYEKKKIKFAKVWEKLPQEGKTSLGITSKEELKNSLDKWCKIRHEFASAKWKQKNSKKWEAKRKTELKKLKNEKNRH